MKSNACDTMTQKPKIASRLNGFVNELADFIYYKRSLTQDHRARWEGLLRDELESLMKLDLDTLIDLAREEEFGE